MLKNICDCFHGLATILVSVCCLQVQQWQSSDWWLYKVETTVWKSSVVCVITPRYPHIIHQHNVDKIKSSWSWIISWQIGFALFVTSYQEYRGQGLVTKFGEEELSCPHSAEITGEVVKQFRGQSDIHWMYVVINCRYEGYRWFVPDAIDWDRYREFYANMKL